MAYRKYQRLKLQGSNDGVNWFDVTPFEYKRGDVIEEDSTDCGGYGGVTEYRWTVIQGEYLCINNDKYQKLKKQYLNIDTDEWVDVEPLETMQGELIEKNSEQCGYGEQWVDTDDWGCKEVEEPTPPTPTTYDVYVLNKGNGTYTINSDATTQPYVYSYGNSVSIHAVPNDGYSFSKFMYGSTIDYGREEYSPYFNLTVMSSPTAWSSVYVKVVFGGRQPTPIVPIITDDVSFQNALKYNGSVLTYFYNDGTLAAEALPPDTYKKVNAAYYVIDFGASLYSLNIPYHSSYLYRGKAIYLPATETIIGRAFMEPESDPRLQSVYLPNCSYLSGAVFAHCTKLTDIYLNRNTVVDFYASSLYPYSTGVFNICGSSFKIHIPSGLYSEYISKYSSVTYFYSNNTSYKASLVDRFVSDL